jgi:hypothetical protein
MNYTEYWKTVNPLFAQIRDATKDYLATIEVAMLTGDKGKVYSSMEIFNCIERFENSVSLIINPLYILANRLFLTNLTNIAEHCKEHPRTIRNKPFIKLVKGGNPNASL